MIVDLESADRHDFLGFDLCIIGGGAAGIAIAREFLGARFSVALLESGGFADEPKTQALYAGESVGERYYRELDQCRTRRFGGSTNCWGGMCTPFTAIDFEQRAWVPFSGWPISAEDLHPFFQKAHELCSVGPYLYDCTGWEQLGRAALPLDAAQLLSHFWQINNRRGNRQVRFGRKFRKELERSRRVTVMLHANVTRLGLNAHGTRMQQVDVRTLSGRTASVRAKVFILACGGLENPRLLLASDDVQKDGIGNDRGVVGRYFHEHLQAPFASVEASEGDGELAGYSRLWSWGGTHLLPGITLSPEAQRRHGALNISVSVDPVFDEDHAWSCAKDLRERMRRGELSGHSARAALKVARHAGTFVHAAYRRVAHGARPEGSRGRFRLYARAEQAPNPASRIRLTHERDALGIRKLALDWRTSALDHTAFRVMASALRSEFERLGLGKVRPFEWIQGDEWPEDLAGGPHHMGATRMSSDPRLGVVDADSKVHGLDGLYVAGCSVFPTGGHANCTLTLLATSLRVADHVKRLLETEAAPSLRTRTTLDDGMRAVLAQRSEATQADEVLT